jgi:hypothetical protein
LREGGEADFCSESFGGGVVEEAVGPALEEGFGGEPKDEAVCFSVHGPVGSVLLKPYGFGKYDGVPE